MAMKSIYKWFGKEPSEKAPLRPKRVLKVTFSGLPEIPEEGEPSRSTREDDASTDPVLIPPPFKRWKRKSTRSKSRRPSHDGLLPQNLAFDQQYPEGAAGPSREWIAAEEHYQRMPDLEINPPTPPRRSAIAECCGSFLDCLCNRYAYA
ncbi:unnamed protein product [Ixodes hexagonus]